MTRSGTSSSRSLSIAALAILCLLAIPFFVAPVATGTPRAQAGVVLFAGVEDYSLPIELSGDWMLDWRTPLGPERRLPGAPFAIKVPGLWAGKTAPGGLELPPQGRATYRLTVRDLPQGSWRLFVPVVQGASRVSVDGLVKSVRGAVGSDAASTRQQWQAHDILIEHQGGDLALAIDVATFLHRANGLEGAPVIGRGDPMRGWIARKMTQETLIQGALMLICIFGFVVFLFRRSDRASLYFALSMLGIMPTSLVIGFDNLFLLIAPGTSLGVMLGIAYCGVWPAIVAMLLYINALFPAESQRALFKAAIALCALGGAVQLGAALFVGTYASSVVSAAIGFAVLPALAYAAITVARAVRAGRQGSAPFLVGALAFGSVAVVLAMLEGGIVSRSLFAGFNTASFGILTLLFSHLIVIAERWSQAIATTEKRNADLRELLEVNSSITSEIKLEALLRRIVEVTSRILGAERSSLFLHDAKQGELWALVAEGVEARQLRVRADEGLAGESFTKGQTVIAADAYAHPKFKSDFDKETGFRTRDIISMPVATREGRKLGVMQALNSSDGFGEEEAERMRAFAAQAAIALDNATLFAEVVSARNYNENILASMSSGVITLDPDLRIAKLNKAACAIFEVEEGRLDGVSARDALTATNPWMLPEIDEVVASGAPKVLLDADLKTASGTTRSVNLSIVPLLNEEERAGLLILVEDISEGKRIQGAMRRFMPQQIVDQVLDREDDLLFGSACRASVLFADIRGFTTLSERLSPRETVDLLNEVFSDLFEAVAESHGILDKYIGDAVMAVYGVPFASERDPANAVAGANAMQAMVAALNARRAARGEEGLRLGIGIATGEVIAGTIGSTKRMDYTVIGDSVNLASRLQDLTKSYGVATILCETTAAAVAPGVRLRELDLIRVRGRSAPARIFETASVGEAAAAAYAQGRAMLAGRDWAGAQAAFEAALVLAPDDRPSAIMRDRALGALASPPPADWDGVW